MSKQITYTCDICKKGFNGRTSNRHKYNILKLDAWASSEWLDVCDGCHRKLTKWIERNGELDE